MISVWEVPARNDRVGSVFWLTCEKWNEGLSFVLRARLAEVIKAQVLGGMVEALLARIDKIPKPQKKSEPLE